MSWGIGPKVLDLPLTEALRQSKYGTVEFSNMVDANNTVIGEWSEILGLERSGDVEQVHSDIPGWNGQGCSYKTHVIDNHPTDEQKAARDNRGGKFLFR